MGLLHPGGWRGLLCGVWSRLQMVYAESELSLLRNMMKHPKQMMCICFHKLHSTHFQNFGGIGLKLIVTTFLNLAS